MLFSSLLPSQTLLPIISPKLPTTIAQETKPTSKNPSFLRVPIPPWMTTPLSLTPDQIIDFSKKKKKPNQKNTNPLTEKVRGGRNRQAMKNIVDSITKLGDIENGNVMEEQEAEVEMEKELTREFSGKMPWARAEEKKMKMVFRREKKEKMVTAAEREIPEVELSRLRERAKRVRKWVRAKKAGLTQEVVEEIFRGWRTEELVMVRIVEPLCRNMDRAHEIVEVKTGGLVVLRKRDTLVVYRKNNCLLAMTPTVAVDAKPSQGILNLGTGCGVASRSTVQKEREEEDPGLTTMDSVSHKETGSINETLFVREADRLLSDLGPRFIDWWWKKPLPVDADLLPEVVPDFKPPFRLCPPRERPKLTDDELTYMRKLALPLPTHFALGKNSKLQGLAAAIIKLWEKSLVAKIAIKVGVPNTNSQQMSWELKRLTGGVLILRNKSFIILYRGKDFLPVKLANSILDRETEIRDQQVQEEEARSKAIESIRMIDESTSGKSNIGTFSEFKEIKASYLPLNGRLSEDKVKVEAEMEKLKKELRDQERKLLILNLKIEKSEKDLANLNSSCTASEESADKELLTEEERQCYQRIGMKMDESLLLGRRGVYDGVIESIHQHWKHREIVKVVTMQKTFQQISYTASLLEMESGGILVAVEKLRSGYAIIIYRGKNYNRPLKQPLGNLLTKREALQRSIVIQRRGSLKYFASQRRRTISELKRELVTISNPFFLVRAIFFSLNGAINGKHSVYMSLLLVLQRYLERKANHFVYRGVPNAENIHFKAGVPSNKNL